MSWKPIEDLPEHWVTLCSSELSSLASIWKEQTNKLRQSEALQRFNERLQREWAIETGIIEHLYTIDRGITQLLIEKGIETSLIPHGSTDKPVEWVVSIIQDQQEVLEGIFDFVAQRRALSTSYIKQLHQVITTHQENTSAINGLGRKQEVRLLRGDWKRLPNNPMRRDGTIHEYCPPEQVASEMDALIVMHHDHETKLVCPEVEAAWLHHRFTQIQPFQDGNGRIARTLASLVFLRASSFPLVIRRDLRSEYIEALEKADQGDLQILIDLFVRVQKQEFLKALSISEDILRERTSKQQIMDAAFERLQARQKQNRDEFKQVLNTSQQLEVMVEKEFRDVVRSLESGLKSIDPAYEVVIHRSDTQNDHWYHKQIIEVAKHFEYYADTRSYRSWLRVRIREERQTEIVISFHSLGVQFFGVLIVSAFILYRNKGDETDTGPEGPFPVCKEVFQFSYQETTQGVKERFIPWLREVVLLGLDQWRRQL